MEMNFRGRGNGFQRKKNTVQGFAVLKLEQEFFRRKSEWKTERGKKNEDQKQSQVK